MIFKPEFKQKILDGTMCATVRKNIQVNINKEFTIKVGKETTAKAKCTGLFYFKNMIIWPYVTVFFNEIERFRFAPHCIEISLKHKALGFDDSRTPGIPLNGEHIKKYFCDNFAGYGYMNEYNVAVCENEFSGYLHIFKLIKKKD